MRKKILASAGIVTILLMTISIMFAADAAGKGAANSIPKLTQDQKDGIFKIENSLKADISAFESDLRQARYDLIKVLSAAVIDEQQAKALHTKITGLQDKVSDKQFQARLDILKLLTPDQRQFLTSRPMEKRGRMGNFAGVRGKGMMNPGGF